MEYPRQAPCRILLKRSVPSMVWFEDAVARYGVPTVVFDLHLIVPNISEAAAILRESGWSPESPNEYSFLLTTTSMRWERLLSPMTPSTRNNYQDPIQFLESHPPGPPPLPQEIPAWRVATVLFSATEWGIKAEMLLNACEHEFYPFLPLLVDMLINQLLNTHFESGIHGQISVMLAYLYGHVPELKDKNFANKLDSVHRQFHLDCVSKQLSLWTIPFVEHERQIRDLIRMEGYELRDCSAIRTPDNQILFAGYLPEELRRERAALRADDPSPEQEENFSDEGEEQEEDGNRVE
ncbi:hypothetical protein F4823DRAFT_594622 [Ustulina deusta]|nr:hypothetical protein F4823DRAFT_594622 [Ustulina deusta]